MAVTWAISPFIPCKEEDEPHPTQNKIKESDSIQLIGSSCIRISNNCTQKTSKAWDARTFLLKFTELYVCVCVIQSGVAYVWSISRYSGGGQNSESMFRSASVVFVIYSIPITDGLVEVNAVTALIKHTHSTQKARWETEMRADRNNSNKRDTSRLGETYYIFVFIQNLFGMFAFCRRTDARSNLA